MSVYERLREERNDGRKKKTKLSPRPQVYSRIEETRRKRNTVWRFYRDRARVLKRIEGRQLKLW